MAKETIKITYVSCMGVLINYDDKNILIDAIVSPDILPYRTIPQKTLTSMLRKSEPFEKIDFILITHEHPEHFHPDLVCHVLSHCPEAKLVAPKAVIKSLQRSRLFKKSFILQCISLEIGLNKSIELTLKGLRFDAMHLAHDGDNPKSATQNIAYLLHLDNHRLLHVGDALADAESFRNNELLEKGITCLIVPFIYVITETGVESILQLNPLHLVALHFPLKKHDKLNRFANAEDIRNAANSPLPESTHFLTECMESIMF